MELPGYLAKAFGYEIFEALTGSTEIIGKIASGNRHPGAVDESHYNY